MRKMSVTDSIPPQTKLTMSMDSPGLETLSGLDRFQSQTEYTVQQNIPIFCSVCVDKTLGSNPGPEK